MYISVSYFYRHIVQLITYMYIYKYVNKLYYLTLHSTMIECDIITAHIHLFEIVDVTLIIILSYIILELPGVS